MLVVDTSVAVKWVVPEDDAHREAASDVALSLLARGLIAPDCIMAEFANALFKKTRLGEIGLDQAREAVAILPDIVSFVPSVPLVAAALEMAQALAHPVHDCLFLTLAVQQGVPLVTADARFVAHCRQRGADLPIHLLSDGGW